MHNRLFITPCSKFLLASPPEVSRFSLITAFFIFAMGSTTALAAAALEVLYDEGQTVAIGQFYASLVTEAQPDPGAVVPSSPIAPLLFPVRTSKMTPGLFTGALRVTKQSYLVSPILLVGDDAISRNWLAKNKEKLQKYRASGIVINVESYDRFKALQNLVPGVQLAPSSADEVASTLGIRKYPVIVTVDGFATQEVR